MVFEYFDRKQTYELYDTELRDVVEKIALEAIVESKWEAHMLGELAAVSLEAFIELKLSDMVSIITASG